MYKFLSFRARGTEPHTHGTTSWLVGCHVINRASTDCKGGVRGVSGVSWQVHIVYIGHSQNGQLAAVKTE